MPQELLVPASKAGSGWRGLLWAAFLRLCGGGITLLSLTCRQWFHRDENQDKVFMTPLKTDHLKRH